MRAPVLVEHWLGVRHYPHRAGSFAANPNCTCAAGMIAAFGSRNYLIRPDLMERQNGLDSLVPG
jgi:hypothetical protein